MRILSSSISALALATARMFASPAAAQTTAEPAPAQQPQADPAQVGVGQIVVTAPRRPGTGAVCRVSERRRAGTSISPTPTRARAARRGSAGAGAAAGPAAAGEANMQAVARANAEIDDERMRI